MSVRTISVVALAVICGLTAAVGISEWGKKQPAQAAPETVSVVVAASDIAKSKSIPRANLTVKQWPKDLVPKGAISDLTAAEGRYPRERILADEPVLEAKLAPRGAGPVTSAIPPGMRAYSIQTSKVSSSVAGFVLPGDKVDVLLNLKSSGNKDDGTGGGSTMTLLQNVEILAVDQRLDATSDAKANPRDMSSVTLVVTPNQSLKLDLGQAQGQLSLSLRNPDDKDDAETEAATLWAIHNAGEGPLRPFEGIEAGSNIRRTIAEVLTPPRMDRYEIATILGGKQGPTITCSTTGKR